MNVEFHTEAEEEFIEASAYYELRVTGLGEKFILELERLCELLRYSPEIGAPIDHPFRRVVFRRFPYSLIYVIEESMVWVAAVAHQRRRPGYWRARYDR